MRGLRASLYKDIKLFLSGAGILSLLLPLLLLPALRWGMGDLSGQSYVRPFPIAVRDLDDTVMSNSLISQLKEIQLFSEVRSIAPDQLDQAALDQGAAAAVTIPKDFFYALYFMSDCPVTVTVNGDMELEGSLFQAIFQAVMGIVRSDQAATLGAYSYVCGELTPELSQRIYSQTSKDLFHDVLGRQQVFSAAAEATDLAAALQRRLLACILSVTALFFALSAAKTLPEEMALGVLPRFRAVGGRLSAFLLSKFCAAFLLTLPVLALAAALFPGDEIWFLLVLDGLLLLAAFGIQTALAAWTGSAAAAQRWGNILLLLSLATGGTLWPRTVLPAPLARLGQLTLPYYAALGLEGRAQALPAVTLAGLLWPLLLMGVAGLALAVPGFRRRSGRRSSPSVPAAGTAQEPPAPVVCVGFPRRLWALGLFKLRAVSGGLRGLAVTVAAALLCGFAAAAVRGAGASELRLAICDLDGTELSAALVESIAADEGVTALACTPERARRSMLTGDVEGILVIEEGYAAALEADEGSALHYESAGSAMSAQGARELAAGRAAAQRSRLRAVSLAEQLAGRTLSQAERAELGDAIDGADAAIPPLYHLERTGGAAAADPFVPGQMSFAALAALFTLLTAASWCGSPDGRMAERRMGSLPRGRLLSYGSDFLALALLGLCVMLAALLPNRDAIGLLPAAALYALAASALALALVRLTALAGRVDALAPFLALLLCLLGGCFLDLGQLSPTARALSCLSPAGLAVRASEGSVPAAAALAAAGAALFALGMPRRKS